MNKNPLKQLIGAANLPSSPRYVARTASPIFPEIAYNVGSTDQKRK
jgi:hypothetical protein